MELKILSTDLVIRKLTIGVLIIVSTESLIPSKLGIDLLGSGPNNDKDGFLLCNPLKICAKMAS